MTLGGNRYDLRELAGAFGDLGTLVPFVVGYVTITGLDPVGILVAFGVSLVGAGLYFRTPVPVQPMKAIATAAINHPATVTAGAIGAANLFTAALWLVMGLTGAVTWLARITSRPVVHGIVLGLGLAFMLEGVRMMQTGLLLAVVAMALTFALLSAGRVPAMLVLLGLGALVAVAREPALLDELLTLGWRPGIPRVAPAAFTWSDVATGVLVLGLPQAALTFGNAVMATVDENNRLFPERPVTVRTLALGHGVMNLVAGGLGGVPMCHGAGGMAGHVRFGARTGGAAVLLGVVLIGAALLLGDSVTTLLRLCPLPILGVILLFGGLELAAGAQGGDGDAQDRYVMVFTAAVAMWNMGAGYVGGLLLWYALRGRWLRL